MTVRLQQPVNTGCCSLFVCMKSLLKYEKDMNEKFDFLPLGSIVVVSGGIKKFVIVARALQVNINGCKQFFDYAACPYPEGMNGDRLMYFQHTDISRVVFEGYVDDDEIMMCDNIFNAMEKTEIERADVRKLKRSMVN